MVELVETTRSCGGSTTHPFLTLTLFIAMFERDHGPMEYQLAYGEAMKHLSMPYPDIAT